MPKKKKSEYSEKGSKKVGDVMKEFYKGELHSGTGKKGVKGPKVKKRSQAAAIGLSEARKRGMKVPAPKKKKFGSGQKKAVKSVMKRGLGGALRDAMKRKKEK